MFKRLLVYFKVVCLVLAVIFILQLVRFAGAKDPLRDVTIPSPSTSLVATVSVVTVSPTNSPSSNAPPGRARPSTKAVDLPPAIAARIEQIKENEVFGAIPKPLPMALLGIIGMDAIIRGSNGQTGLVREGDEFGGVKVLRLGTNRVLVEHEGQKKELTIFSGFGSESLMTPGKENVP